ncbi:MAG: monofunctional biosynthetic peptidoglycan transglycosylase [Lysobacter sp.]|nr:monofunctional biosynthetic peptidoglycan transglycosylase [Lysobacter sp.]
MVQDDEMNASGQLPRRKRTFRLGRWLVALPLLFILVTTLQVLSLRFVAPPFTAFMVARQASAWAQGDWDFRLAYDWRDLDRMTLNLPLAMVAAEDQNFPAHRGFDMKAITRAMDSNARGGKVRGGSTISQQTAKNVFLWSGRSWVRKGLEAWYTVLIEVLWPKWRILEVYANVAEFGDGIYGAQAAARTYFGKDAVDLSRAESARLAAVLPSPKRYSVVRPGPYVQRRSRAIERQMRQLGGTGYLQQIE